MAYHGNEPPEAPAPAGTGQVNLYYAARWTMAVAEDSYLLLDKKGKPFARFPLSEEGWRDLWNQFCGLAPKEEASARHAVMQALARESALQQARLSAAEITASGQIPVRCQACGNYAGVEKTVDHITCNDCGAHQHVFTCEACSARVFMPEQVRLLWKCSACKHLNRLLDAGTVMRCRYLTNRPVNASISFQHHGIHVATTGLLATNLPFFCWPSIASLDVQGVNQMGQRLTGFVEIGGLGLIGQRGTKTGFLIITLTDGAQHFLQLPLMPVEISAKLAQVVPSEHRDRWTLPPPLPSPSEPSPDVFDQIRKLGQLRDAGLITAEEFEAKKEELLGRL